MASLSALVGYGGGESDSDSASTPVSPQSTEGDVVLVGAEGSKDTQQSNEGDGVLVGSSASAEGKERDQKDMDSTAGVDGSPNGVDASLKRSALDDEENADSDGDYPFACKKIKLPPPVVGEVDMELNERITKYITLSKDKGRNFNARLRTNKNFQNPHICEVLVQQLGLNETQSMCAKHIFDPAEFDDKGCYYQDLYKKQKMHAEQLIKKTRAEAAAAASVPYTATAGATNREVDAVKAKAQAQAIAKMLGSQKKLSGRTSAMK